MVGGVEPQRPRVIARIVIGLLVLWIAWYLVTKVLALFDDSIGMRSAVLLTVRGSSDNVQVSLQGGEWQHGESSLKLYAGDAVAVRGNADVLVTMFDGSRARLNQGSDVLVEKSDKTDHGTSAYSLKIRSGRLWLATPTTVSFSGAITRTVSTSNFIATFPENTQALVSSQIVTVLKAGDLGAFLDLSQIKRGAALYVGEGQYFSLTDDGKKAIASGGNPYDERDPITPQMLKDDFLATSYALLSQAAITSGQTKSASGTELEIGDLKMSSPENHTHIKAKTAKVSGEVSSRVALVLVNGQNVPIHKDLSFSVDMSLTKDPTTALHIEAQDAQGIMLEAADLSVFNDYQPVVAAPRIKSPVGSGETLKTSLKEIEITGEAPAGTSQVVLNDYKLQLFKPGDKTWSYLASTALGNLVVGKNTFTVYTLDADGNKSQTRMITIEFSLTAPPVGTGATVSSASSSEPPLKQNPPMLPGTLEVSSPTTGAAAITPLSELSIIGSTSSETNSISVNGYTLSLYQPGSTSWKYIASTTLSTMKRGRNVYRIVSRNKDGEILDVLEYTITYQP